jgi:hypothetical protein
LATAADQSVTLSDFVVRPSVGKLRGDLARMVVIRRVIFLAVQDAASVI